MMRGDVCDDSGVGMGRWAAEGVGRPAAVRIPAGTNEGKDPDFGDYALTVEEPFHMDATEVTWAHWREVRDWAVTNGYDDLAGVGAGKADDHPVQGVNWVDSVKWCNARSAEGGPRPLLPRGRRDMPPFGRCAHCCFGFRSATHHIEWEYAARGGQVGKRYPWGDTISQSRPTISASLAIPTMWHDARSPSDYAKGRCPTLLRLHRSA